MINEVQKEKRLNTIKSILKTNRKKRRQEDLIEFIQPIVKTVKFLDGSQPICSEKIVNMSKEDIAYIYKYNSLNMKLESCKKGRSIIKHGERGDKFYIILKGKVSVQLPP